MFGSVWVEDAFVRACEPFLAGATKLLIHRLSLSRVLLRNVG